MINDSRTLEELEALEQPLNAWHGHPKYSALLSAFVAKVRALVATPPPPRLKEQRSLSIAEFRRITRQLVRISTHAELDAFVERVHIRFGPTPRRDDFERLARVRRDRLSRVAPPTLRWHATDPLANGDTTWKSTEASPVLKPKKPKKARPA
jgi:hypothetical protein